ncbi:2-hydroxyacid dehydrogenase [Shimia ponticola]|uniref:2-hydroxyacid dehydrogenase n=1 Tax=Shimia ponticola TaxID=2582893 RepID=UPI0011BF0D48|nr:glyoxylate/hydroxypyruvate reductase A [Shimia ponticola]
MTLTVLFAAKSESWSVYEAALTAAFSEAELNADLVLEAEPDTVDYIIYAPDSELQDFTLYTSCKAVLNLWAGVENVVGNESLTQPLARMVDPGMTAGMVEYVTAHVMRHHLDLDRYIKLTEPLWEPKMPKLAEDRVVTILGLGALGGACATTLASLGFQVRGWSRSQKSIDGVATFSAGPGLAEALPGTEILVLLTPLTDDTENIIDANALSLLAEGAVIINPGRGPLIDDDALLNALDDCQISHATLDVFREEPLPPNHPFWNDPRVTVTPHVASFTRPKTASRQIAANIQRSENGEPLIGLVDREAGY